MARFLHERVPAEGTGLVGKRAGLTSRDLARELGVSQSAISRAFNPNASIAPALRAKVLAAAEAADYVPNSIASSLSRRRSNIIAILAGDFANPFYPDVVARLSRAFQAADRQCLLFTLEPGERPEERLALLRRFNVDAAVIVSATIHQTTAEEWSTAGKTAVLFNRIVPEAPVSSVSCDNREGAALIARHLVATGRRRIAFAAGPRDTSTTREREQGFKAALREAGLAPIARAQAGEYSLAAGFRTAEKLAPAEPDAIFFANDIMAIGGIEWLRQAGRAVPADVAVAGFDDIPMAAWPSYDLTTISQPVEAMIERTVRLICSEGTEPGPVAHHLPGRLVVRGSTGGAASAARQERAHGLAVGLHPVEQQEEDRADQRHGGGDDDGRGE